MQRWLPLIALVTAQWLGGSQSVLAQIRLPGPANPDWYVFIVEDETLTNGERVPADQRCIAIVALNEKPVYAIGHSPSKGKKFGPFPSQKEAEAGLRTAGWNFMGQLVEFEGTFWRARSGCE